MKSSLAAAFISLGAVLASPAASAGSLPAPPAADGLYLGHHDAAGVFSWSLHEHTAPSARRIASKLFNPPGRAFCKRYAAGSAEDIHAAVQAMEAGCQQMRFQKAIAFRWDGVVAYGCNHLDPDGAVCNGDELVPYFAEVVETCGAGNAGYYVTSERDVSYGYTKSDDSIC